MGNNAILNLLFISTLKGLAFEWFKNWHQDLLIREIIWEEFSLLNSIEMAWSCKSCAHKRKQRKLKFLFIIEFSNIILLGDFHIFLSIQTLT